MNQSFIILIKEISVEILIPLLRNRNKINSVYELDSCRDGRTIES
jgi:hypothetical protein